jgi:hypothetical protein
MSKETLEQLQADRGELRKQLAKIERKISRQLIPVARSEWEAQYRDTYWTYPVDYEKGKKWYGFAHIKSIDHVWEVRDGTNCRLVCDIIEEYPNGNFRFLLATKDYGPNLFKTKITKAVFQKKKAALLKKLDNL